MGKNSIKTMKSASKARFCPTCGSEILKKWKDLSEDERFIAVRRGFQPGGEPLPGQLFCARCLVQIAEPAAKSA